MHHVHRQLKRALQHHLAVARPIAQRFDLTPSRFEVLCAIRERRRPRQADISRALGVTPVTVSRMLRRLEELGLVARAMSPTDKRAKLVELTPEGEARVTRAAPAFEGLDPMASAPSYLS
jgi:DNA-binding MarR family transcriptional regulator